MVVDSSAVIAIALREPGYEQFPLFIRNDNLKYISVASILECTVVMTRKPTASEAALDRLLQELDLRPVEVSFEQLTAARQAYRKYGKGIHPAALNFGDCFSYALAKISEEPLLFKGNDFSQTDITSAIAL